MNTDDMNDMVLMGMARDEAYSLLAEAQAEIERLRAEVDRITEINEKNKAVAAKVVLEKFDILEQIHEKLAATHNDAIEAAEKWVSARYKTSNYSWYNDGMLIRALKK